MLRALLSGNRDLFDAALAELSGLRDSKVAGLLRDYNGPGFAALYAKAGLPGKYLAAFRAALAAQREYGAAHDSAARLSMVMIERVLTACEDIGGPEMDRLMALLRRFEMEAALEEAREAAAAMTAPEDPGYSAFAGAESQGDMVLAA